jgi:hypothetical protein
MRQHLLQSDSTFFVVAIYVDENMCASRYILMQIEHDGPEVAEQPLVSDHNYVGTRHSTE